jgi:hypothetical protein
VNDDSYYEKNIQTIGLPDYNSISNKVTLGAASANA